jgi:hypothetical protein
MIKRGTIDPREGYNYAKAREDLIMNKSRENTGIAGTAVEALGGGVSPLAGSQRLALPRRARSPKGPICSSGLLPAQRMPPALVASPGPWKATG